MYYQPTPISWQDYHFLIMSAPDDQSMGKCIKDLKTNNVKLVVRTCQQSYNEDPLKEANIDVRELQFPDGQLPTKEIIKQWL